MRRVIALATPLLLIGLAAAPQVHAQDARAAFDRFSEDLQGLDGRFEQRVYDANGHLSEESTGTIALRTPRQFRWEYVDPFPQLIVADGNHVWIYDPDLEQVNVRIQSHEEQSSPLAVLIDPDELERQFSVAGGGGGDGLDWMVLTPRGEDAQFDQARLAFDAGGELVRMELDDSLGQKTQVQFSDWVRNPGFDDGHFSFDPPEGVDVVGEMAEAAEVMPIQ